MVKNINLPIVIGFETAAAAEDFLEAAELIVPKLKLEDLDDTDAATGQRLFMFYTRKDKNYRDMRKNYGTVVTTEETIEFGGWQETGNI